MPMLPDAAREQVRERLESELTGNVRLSLFTQRGGLIIVPGRECPTCKETGELMEEVSSLSDKLDLEVHDVYTEPELASERGIERIPAIIIEGDARGSVRYFGIPAGSEFPAFVQDLIDVSKGTTSLSDASKESLAALSKDVHVQVFVTPTCPYCPQVARVAHQMGVESEKVRADVIEVSEFPEMARRYGVSGVPKTVINDQVELLGAQPEAAFVQAVCELGSQTGPSEETS